MRKLKISSTFLQMKSGEKSYESDLVSANFGLIHTPILEVVNDIAKITEIEK